jgi:hypothetical protein
MKDLDLHVEETLWPGRSLRTGLVVVSAILLVVLLAPFTIRPFLQNWKTQKNASVGVEEPWPTAPATYAAPSIASAPTPPSPQTALPEPTWQELNYLTSVEFTASSVVSQERTADLMLVGSVVTDRLLLKAVGKVQVGINLGQVSHVQISGKKIHFSVPAPEVISVELLPNQSEIYDRQQVIFLSQYEGMEKAALEQARLQLRTEVANNMSMMKLAQDFARLQLSEFLHKTGFVTVEIDFLATDLTE